MELFKGKPLSKVTFDEMRRELTDNEVAEGFFVDYKADFPDKLHKYVASFANSHGGYIFIGIKEHPVKKTAEAFDGIPKTSDLSEKARNLIRSHVSPFPLVEIVSIPLSADASRVIVVIRVPESSIAPHICNDGKVYMRNEAASDPADPIKDRFTLDQLYAKSQVMEEMLAKRLARTITAERLYKVNKWNEPSSSTSMAFSTIIYPSDLAGSMITLSDSELRSAIIALGRASNIRHLKGGIAAVSGAGDKLTSPDWWKAPSIFVAYEDGLIEHITQSEGSFSKLSVNVVVAEALDNAYKHAQRLARHTCIGTLIGEIHLLGVWGARFLSNDRTMFPEASNQCDHGVVVHRFELPPVITQHSQQEWDSEDFPKLAAAIVKDLMSEAGGKDFNL